MSLQNVGVLIVGAGITGVAFGRLLQMSDFDDFLIVESEAEAGGLCRTKIVDGHVLDIGGGHLLCSRHPEVYRFIFSHIPEEDFRTFERRSTIVLGEDVIDYPIEYNLWQLPKERQIDFLISCVRAGELEGRRSPRSFREWAHWKLGDRIAESYMIPYNRKIWGVDPDALDIDWLEKIPRFDLRLVVGSCLERQADRSLMPSHQTFLYPKTGGFQTVFDAIHAPVKERVLLSTPLQSLRRRGSSWIVNDRYSCETIVNTIPWPEFHKRVARGPGVARELRRLKTSSLVVSLHNMSFPHDWHWSYVADPGAAHHRDFFITNFAPHSAPDGVFRETNGLRFKPSSSDLYAQSSTHAYPIPLQGHAAAARRVWGAYAEQGILGLGRWGQHRYYNADVCIREAMGMAGGYLKGGQRGAAEAMEAADPALR